MNLTLRQGISKMRLAAGVALAFVVLLGLGVATPSAQAQTFTMLHDFMGANDNGDGALPNAALIMDASGNLYGTTLYGGEWNYGAVFEMAKTSTGYSAPEILYSFTGQADGQWPEGALLFVGTSLYGTTYVGGTAEGACDPHTSGTCGTVFEISPGKGGVWTETTLYTFAGGNDGGNPQAGLIKDSKGNLYGTTRFGGDNDTGTVFELVKGTKTVGKKKVTTYTEQVLYSFGSYLTDGNQPVANLILDKAGNLYGTTIYGAGNNSHPGYATNAGTVFKLTPPTTSGGAWTETLLYSFCQIDPESGCADGTRPAAGLIFDSKGNLYGTTEQGGSVGQGTVFELSPTTSAPWKETVLYSFCPAGSPCTDGASPDGGVVMKGSALYGTTLYGGDPNSNCNDGGSGSGPCGTVFELSWKTAKGKTTYTEKVLYAFQNNATQEQPNGDGGNPGTGLVMDKAGNLYGTTSLWGYYGDGFPQAGGGAGTVFKVVP